jgi:hypothetical protein
MVFVFYDCLYRGQDKVMARACRYCFVAIPSNVRDRILKDAEEQAEQDMLNKKGFFGAAPKNRLKTFLDEDSGSAGLRYETDR